MKKAHVAMNDAKKLNTKMVKHETSLGVHRIKQNAHKAGAHKIHDKNSPKRGSKKAY